MHLKKQSEGHFAAFLLHHLTLASYGLAKVESCFLSGLVRQNASTKLPCVDNHIESFCILITN